MLRVTNSGPSELHLKLKDEYPHEMRLGGEREAEFILDPQTSAEFTYELTPPRGAIMNSEKDGGPISFAVRTRLVPGRNRASNSR